MLSRANIMSVYFFKVGGVVYFFHVCIGMIALQEPGQRIGVQMAKESFNWCSKYCLTQSWHRTEQFLEPQSWVGTASSVGIGLKQQSQRFGSGSLAFDIFLKVCGVESQRSGSGSLVFDILKTR